MYDILYYVGYLMPYILFFITMYFLRNKQIYLVYYICGYFINLLLNVILKIIIKHPRPTENIHTFNSALSHGKYVGIDRFGMPSGHAQNIFFTTVYIYLVLQNDWILLTYLLLALFTSYTRITYKRHYLMQVIIGSIIGIFLGYLFYYSASKNIMGILKYKKDDNALF